MDGLICVWDKRAVRCDNLREHNGSVSEILVDDRDFGVSLGYDHSAKVWNFNSLRMLVNC